THRVQPREVEPRPLRRPGERLLDRSARTLLRDRIEILRPLWNPLLSDRRVDHKPVVSLVGRLAHAVGVDLEIELEVGRLPAANATLPAATVSRTLPLSVCPRAHEFTERERKLDSSTFHVAAVSSRTRFAGAPTAIRGRSSPYTRAGPADNRSSSVSSGTKPV